MKLSLTSPLRVRIDFALESHVADEDECGDNPIQIALQMGKFKKKIEILKILSQKIAIFIVYTNLFA